MASESRSGSCGMARNVEPDSGGVLMVADVRSGVLTADFVQDVCESWWDSDVDGSVDVADLQGFAVNADVSAASSSRTNFSR